jgi:hypothetical protein
VTIKTRRAMSVVLGSGVGVIALSAAACPAANAAKGDAPTTPKPTTTARRERGHARARRRSSAPKPTVRNGDYVYEVIIGNTETNQGKPNMTCSGSSMRITELATFPEGKNAVELWEPASWNRLYTITTGPATTITVSWTPPAERQEAEEEAAAHNGFILNPRLWGQDNTAPVSAVCGATSPGAVVGEIRGAQATWVLSSPVSSAAALMATPPTNIYPAKYAIAFEVLPNGTVPAFSPFS